MNKIKIILSYFLGFILSVCIFILAIVFVSKKTFLDKNFIYRLFDENNYYENVYNSINEDILDYMTSSGLESSVLDNVILKDNVKTDIDSYLDGLYSNNLYSVDTSYIEKTLKSNIDNFLKGLNLGIDNTNELDLFISDIAQIYKKQVSFYNTLDGAKGILSKVSNIIEKYMIILIVVVCLLLVLVIIMGYLNIGSAVLGSGIMLFILRMFIFERIDGENILLISDNFSSIIRSSFKYMGNYMVSISLILMIIGFILCLFKNKKNSLEKRSTN